MAGHGLPQKLSQSKSVLTREKPGRLHASSQRSSFYCNVNQSGHYDLLSRATDAKGRIQPLDGVRNSMHRVGISVVYE